MFHEWDIHNWATLGLVLSFRTFCFFECGRLGGVLVSPGPACPILVDELLRVIGYLILLAVLQTLSVAACSLMHSWVFYSDAVCAYKVVLTSLVFLRLLRHFIGLSVDVIYNWVPLSLQITCFPPLADFWTRVTISIFTLFIMPFSIMTNVCDWASVTLCAPSRRNMSLLH